MLCDKSRYRLFYSPFYIEKQKRNGGDISLEDIKIKKGGVIGDVVVEDITFYRATVNLGLFKKKSNAMCMPEAIPKF